MAKLAGSILLAALSMSAVADRGADLSQAGATEPAVRAGAQGGPGRAKAAARGGRGPGLGYPDPEEAVNPAPRPVRDHGRGEGVGVAGHHPDSGSGRPIRLYRLQRQHGDRLRTWVPQGKQAEPSPGAPTAVQE